MKKNNKKVKILLLILISIVFSIFSLATLAIVDYSQNEKIIEIEIDDNDNSQIQISNIVIAGNTQDLSIFQNDNLIYNSDYNFLYNQKNNITITTNILDDIAITFIKNKDNAFIKIKEIINDKQEKISYIDTKEDNISFTDYYSNITIKEILRNEIIMHYDNLNIYILFLGFTLIFSILFYFINYFVDKIKFDKEIKLYDLILLTIAVFIIFLSHIYLFIEVFNYIYVLFLIFVIIFIFFKLRHKKNKIENIFILFCIMGGMIFIFIHPPFNVPDEAKHFLKAYSNTLNTKEKKQYIAKNKTYDATILVNDDLYNFLNKYNYNIHSIDYKTTMKSTLQYFNKKIENNDKPQNIIWFGSTSNLNAFCYIPTILTMNISTWFNLSLLLTFLLGRLTNFTIFFIILYYCIKKIPCFKKTIMLVALMPITIEMAAAFSQDSITNTLSFCLLSLILEKIYSKNKNYSYKDFFVISIVAIMISFCKLAYFPSVLLLLIIPKEKFKNKKEKYIITLSIIVLTIFISVINIKLMNSTPSSGTYYPVSEVFTSPVKTVFIFLNTFLERGNLDLLTGLINGFGWSTKWGKHPLLIYLIQSIYLLSYLTINNNEAKKQIIKPKQRFFFLVTTILVVGIIYCSLLIGWSDPNTTMVQGLQSRYFLPIIPLLLIVLTNNIFTINPKVEKYIFMIFLLISFSITLLNLITGFYI